MGSNLTKKQTLMIREEVCALGPEYQAFSYVDEDGELDSGVHIHTSDWEDMGYPEEVTVTIEPGDHLNGVQNESKNIPAVAP